MRPLHFTFVSVLMLSVLGGAASASGPRTITPEETPLPTCFGFTSGGSHVYAVRAKTTCDAATGKCESATFLARVDKAGAHKTAGYLTYRKGDGVGTPADLIKSVKADTLAKAQAAMADATSPCSAARSGDELALSSGRKVKAKRNGDGTWTLESDNLLVEKTVAAGQLLWGPDSETWFIVSTDLPAAPGGVVESTFSGFSAVALRAEPARPPSPKATPVTLENLTRRQCLGYQSTANGLGRFWFQLPSADRVGVLDVGGEPAQNLFADLATTPPRVSAFDLARLNGALEKVEAPCALTEVGQSPVELTVAGTKLKVRVIETPEQYERRRFELVGPKGARVRLPHDAGPDGFVLSTESGVLALVSSGPYGTTSRLLPVSKLTGEPAVFPLPATLSEPACFTDGTRTLLLVWEKRGDKVELKLSESFSRTERAFASGEGDPNAFLASLSLEARLDLGDRYSGYQPCPITPMPETLELEGGRYAPVSRDGIWWLVGERDQIEIGRQKGPPRWFVRAPRMLSLVFESEAGLESIPILNISRYPLPEAPEVAARAPKLIGERPPTIEPADRRCLAWNSKTRVAWVVRHLESCSLAHGECTKTVVLAEVKSDGGYQRVTLAKDDKAWSHMFAGANKLVSGADKGCLAGESGEVRGLRFEVLLDDLKVMVKGPEKTLRATVLDRTPHEYLRTVFWHPEVNAIALEIQQEFPGTSTQRYVWFDLAKVGIK